VCRYVAPCRHLQLTAEVALGLKSLEGYRQYDLVRVGANEVGVIIQVGREHLRLLLQDGTTKRVSPAEVLNDLNMKSKRATLVTADKETLAVEDTVQVISGDYQNTVATVRHIHKAFLFLYSNTMSDNAGVFVVKARQVKLNGTRSANPVQTLLEQGYQVPGFPRSRFHILKLKEQNQRSEAQQAESLMGKQVRVVRGDYKGRFGRVSNMRQDICFVGLTSLAKRIPIHKNNLVIVDPSALRMGGGLGGAAGGGGGATGSVFSAGPGLLNQDAAAAAARAGEMTGAPGGNTPLLMTGDRTPMVLDSGGHDDDDDDPWDPDASGFDECVAWAFQGVVVTMDNHGDERWVLCEEATDKYDDQRVRVRSESSGRVMTVELAKLHFVNPDGTGMVVVIAGIRAGGKGFIAQYNVASSTQTVTFQGEHGDTNVTMSVDDLAVYNPKNSPDEHRR
jgi:transcription elongation factor